MRPRLGVGAAISRAINLASFLLLPLAIKEAGLPTPLFLLTVLTYCVGIPLMGRVKVKSPHLVGPLINIVWAWIYAAIFILEYMGASKWFILAPTTFAGLAMGIGDGAYLSIRPREPWAIAGASSSLLLSIIKGYWFPLAASIASYSAAIAAALLMRGAEPPRAGEWGFSTLGAVGSGLSIGAAALFAGQFPFYLTALISPLLLRRRAWAAVLLLTAFSVALMPRPEIGAAAAGAAAWAYTGWTEGRGVGASVAALMIAAAAAAYPASGAVLSFITLIYLAVRSIRGS
ncbi:hypothetical protein [Thermocladium modestius]|uniref:hypothetical protein n=1 Tax=Thermocladium modestius TaxID=62609 RepID=UPI001665BD4E|nr:hypothetical protein [Thermocladium modestius]